MRKSINITNTKEYKQLRGIFHSAIVKDIDFTQWYKQIRFIIACDEYLGIDYPMTGVFLLDFEHVRLFNLNVSESADISGEITSIPPFRPTGLSEYTQECTNEKRKFYRVVLTGYGPVTSLEIHFDVLQIRRLCDYNDIEHGSNLLTLDSKKRFYDTLKYKYKTILD